MGRMHGSPIRPGARTSRPIAGPPRTDPAAATASTSSTLVGPGVAQSVGLGGAGQDTLVGGDRRRPVSAVSLEQRTPSDRASEGGDVFRRFGGAGDDAIEDVAGEVAVTGARDRDHPGRGSPRSALDGPSADDGDATPDPSGIDHAHRRRERDRRRRRRHRDRLRRRRTVLESSAGNDAVTGLGEGADRATMAGRRRRLRSWRATGADRQRSTCGAGQRHRVRGLARRGARGLRALSQVNLAAAGRRRRRVARPGPTATTTTPRSGRAPARPRTTGSTRTAAGTATRRSTRDGDGAAAAGGLRRREPGAVRPGATDRPQNGVDDELRRRRRAVRHATPPRIAHELGRVHRATPRSCSG